MRTKIILTLAAGLVGFAFAGTSCNQAAGKQISGLAVSSPDTKTGPTLGSSFEIKWQPTSGYSTVSILLLKGPSTNVVPFSCIANSIPNSGSYTWSVPSSGINPQSTGYGIQIIADGSGDFQYSTQFGISGSGSDSSSSGGDKVVAITSTTLLSGQKVTETIYHTSLTTTSSCSTTSTSSSSSSSVFASAPSSHRIIHSSLHHNRTSSSPTNYATAYTSQIASASAKNVTESVQPTVTMSVPASLANVGGSGHAITTPADVASSTAAAAPAGTTTAKAAGAPGRMVGAVGGWAVGLVGVVALVL